jgi:hypothetical protein
MTASWYASLITATARFGSKNEIKIITGMKKAKDAMPRALTAWSTRLLKASKVIT